MDRPPGEYRRALRAQTAEATPEGAALEKENKRADHIATDTLEKLLEKSTGANTDEWSMVAGMQKEDVRNALLNEVFERRPESVRLAYAQRWSEIRGLR